MAKIYSNNFDAAPDGSLAGWDNFAGGFNVAAPILPSKPVSGAKAFCQANVGVRSFYSASGVLGNQELRVAHYTPTLAPSGFRFATLGLRSQDFTDATGYRFQLIATDGTGLVARFVRDYGGGAVIGTPSSGAFAPAPTDLVHRAFRIIGNTLTACAWLNNNPRPTAPVSSATEVFITVTDTTYATGFPFVQCDSAANGLQAAIDNLVVTDGAGGDDFFYQPVVTATLSAPTATKTGTTTATGAVTTDQGNGTLYRMVDGNATATAAAVKAANLTTAVSASGVQNVAFTGLPAGSQLYAHYVQNNGTDSNVVNSAAFTTDALPAAVLTGAAGTATGTTTATASVSTDTASGTIYYLFNTSATATATAVKAGASQAVTTTGAQNVSASGLTAGTQYYSHFVQVANGLDSNVANGAGFTTATVSAPVLSSPSGTATGTTTATASVSTTVGSGTLYAYASVSATEVLATVKASGTQKTVTATGAQSVNLTGLSANTQYYLHFSQNANSTDSGVSNSTSFTTQAVSVTYTPVCALKAAADGALAANVAIHAFVHDKTTGALVGTKTGLTSSSAGIPPAFTASFGVSNTQYDVKFVDDANALRRSLELITAV